MSNKETEILGIKIPAEGKIVVLIIVAVILLSLIGASVINVPAGNKGVAVAGFGVGNQYDEGWNWKNPLTSVENVRWNTQIESETLSARSVDGYNVDIDFAIRFHLVESKVGEIRVKNPDYKDTVVISILRSTARKVVSDWNMTGEEMNLRRTDYEGEVEIRVTVALLVYHVVVEEVMLRNLDFPDRVNEAWEKRVAAEIDVETAGYELEAERLRALKELMRAEAERNSTIVLAEGNAEALRILANETAGLTNQTMESILAIRYITMLRYPDCNVKFVIITDKDQPFIFSMDGMITA